jgi:hypothetical protein
VSSCGCGAAHVGGREADDVREEDGSGTAVVASVAVRKAKGLIMAEKWIQKAIKKPGALRESMGVKKGETIPAAKLAAAAKKPGKMGQRARLAQTLRKLGK